MAVYLLWTSDPLDDLHGPWRESRWIAPGVALIDSPETLSRVYHEVKWQLADDAALMVSPVEHTPKSRGMAPGTTSWLRHRTPPSHP